MNEDEFKKYLKQKVERYRDNYINGRKIRSESISCLFDYIAILENILERQEENKCKNCGEFYR